MEILMLILSKVTEQPKNTRWIAGDLIKQELLRICVKGKAQ
jgi:hypothetical protein